MMLGELLDRFGDEDIAADTLLALGDLALFADLRARAEAEGISLGSYAVRAVHRYSEQASDEEWVTLMGEFGRCADPALALIRRALKNAANGTAPTDAGPTFE